MTLDHDHCYAALTARDSRFDGLFFVGVSTTGIYCRPVCRVRTPGRDRCAFFPTAAAAEAEGFRPCLRCRPELAPGCSSEDRVRGHARTAFDRIQAGALDEGDVGTLAATLGIGERQLRRAVESEYGVTPVELAQTRRLLLAKQLLTDTPLKVADVAFASGFSSLRRFNELFRARYRMPPSGLRKMRPVGAADGLVLKLGYRPPLNWSALAGFLASRGAERCEQFDGVEFRRTLRVGTRRGWIAASPAARGDVLEVRVAPALLPAVTPLLARLRRLFDLDANPAQIEAQLRQDPVLAARVERYPGLRVPGAVDGFEIALRAVLGQQVSVKAASTLYSRSVEAFGEPVETPFAGLDRLPPTAEALAAAPAEALMALGVMRRRAETIGHLARAVADGAVRLDGSAPVSTVIDELVALPGIGPWTAQYVAMRALGDPDVLPLADLGLLKALGLKTPRQMQARAEAWRPWRAYAASHIWNALGAGG